MADPFVLGVNYWPRRKAMYWWLKALELEPDYPMARQRIAEACRAKGDLDKARQEMGDLLFVMANLARHLDIDPEEALRKTNAKFLRRFHYIEAELKKRGKTPEQSDLQEMDALWDAAKLHFKKSDAA